MKQFLNAFKNTFNNLNTLNDMVLNKASKMLKTGIEEDKNLIAQNLKSEKPTHLTDEEWENYKKLGEKLLKI